MNWRVVVAAVWLVACGGEPRSDASRVTLAEQPAESTGADEAPPPSDPFAGMVFAPGAELVLQNCVTCHGPKQFLQQRGDRETWLGLIRWMQREHGLWALAPDVEDRIVDYLATHYGPEQRGRRAPIPAALMPPDPFAPSAAAEATDGR